MGLLDRFKKKEEPKIMPATPGMKRESTMSIDEFVGKDGKRYVEVNNFNSEANLKDFYDSTRLIVCEEPTILPSGKTVYNAQVSWYGENDAVMFGKHGEEISRRGQMTDIKLGMDFVRLLSQDKEYHIVLMRDLLNQARVKRYMAQGLQDDPKQPCGNYIGEVRASRDETTKQIQYRKVFDVPLGREVHYSPEQTELRQQYKQTQEERRQKMIADKQKQMRKLQEEIDGLSK